MVEKRVHTWWVVRERYRRIGWAASAVGLALTVALIAMSAYGQPLAELLTPRFVVVAAVMVLASFLVPRLAVQWLWRRQKIRHTVDWY